MPDPEPVDDEVCIRVLCAGVNPIDRSIYTGRFPWISTPHTPGVEASGEVESVGPLVRGLEEGDRVVVYPKKFCGRCMNCIRGNENLCLENLRMASEPYLVYMYSNGAWAEKAIAPERNLLKVPRAVPNMDAACHAVDGLTALHMISRASPVLGESVLVIGGTGGVGSFCVQLAKLQGLRVSALVSSPNQVKAAERLGAEVVIVRGDSDFERKLFDFSNGKGVDIVLDTVGASGLEAGYRVLGPGGRFASCGVLTGKDANLNLLRLYCTEAAVIGSTGGSRAELQALLSLAARGAVKPLVDSVFDFAQLKSATARLDSHGRLGKVMLRVGRD